MFLLTCGVRYISMDSYNERRMIDVTNVYGMDIPNLKNRSCDILIKKKIKFQFAQAKEQNKKHMVRAQAYIGKDEGKKVKYAECTTELISDDHLLVATPNVMCFLFEYYNPTKSCHLPTVFLQILIVVVRQECLPYLGSLLLHFESYHLVAHPM
eukprot:902183_1